MIWASGSVPVDDDVAASAVATCVPEVALADWAENTAAAGANDAAAAGCAAAGAGADAAGAAVVTVVVAEVLDAGLLTAGAVDAAPTACRPVEAAELPFVWECLLFLDFDGESEPDDEPVPELDEPESVPDDEPAPELDEPESEPDDEPESEPDEEPDVGLWCLPGADVDEEPELLEPEDPLLDCEDADELPWLPPSLPPL